MRPIWWAAAVAVAALPLAGPLAAQDNPALREAVRLAGEGRTEDARRLVDAELGRVQPGEPAYVEALFARARVATLGDSAERDLRRIAIEYPTSAWADDALLLLAQLALAAGNPASAFALAERLRSDYPDSDLRPRAAFWAGRASFEVGDPRTACALLDTARTEGAADIEFVNQVGFYRGRCGAVASTPNPPGQPPAAAAPPVPPAASPDSETARPAGPAADSSRPPAQQAPAAVARTAGFAVQVAAVRTDTEERRVLQLLHRGGVEGRAVPGADGYRRIRVEGYATEREAQAAVSSLRRLVGGRPFVVRLR